MMNSLYISQSGLKGSRYAIDNTSNNMANLNTEGYNKRVSNLSELAPTSNDKIGSGLSFDSIDRINNTYLYNKIISQTSTTSYYSQQNAILGDAELAFQEAGENGFSTSLNNYYQAIESLRTNPNDLVYKNNLSSQANQMTNQIKSTYDSLEEIQEDSQELLEEQVNSVNEILNEISYLNKQIFESSENPNDLYDKRDLLEKELSTYADIKVTPGENYQLEIAGEVAIFNNTNVHHMNIETQNISQKDIYDTTALNDNNLIDGQTITLNLNNTISVDIVIETTGTSNYDVKNQIIDAINNDSTINKELDARLDTNGNLIIESKKAGEESSFDLEIEIDEANTIIEKSEIKSLEAQTNTSVYIYNDKLNLKAGSLNSLTKELTTSTSSISSYKKSLDEFIKAFVDINSAYIKIDDDYIYGETNTKEYTGVESIDEINLFSGSSVETFTFNESALDNLRIEDINYMATLQWKEDIPFNEDLSSSFSKFYQNLRYQVSSEKENTNNIFKAQESITMTLENDYAQLTNVDNDEELINLMKFQSAYEANAKVVTAVDEMLQTILKM